MKAEFFDPKLKLPINYKRKALINIHNANQYTVHSPLLFNLHLFHDGVNLQKI